MTDVSISEAARALAAQRPTEVIVCTFCKAEKRVIVQSGSRAARTCSKPCRNRLTYLERKAAKPKP